MRNIKILNILNNCRLMLIKIVTGRKYDYYLQSVKESCWNVKYVPKMYLTKELCLVTIESNVFAMSDIPPECIDAEIAFKAIEINPYTLKYIPEHLKSYDLCLEAVRDCGVALDFVPEKHKTYELCLKAVRARSGVQAVPEHIRNDRQFKAETLGCSQKGELCKRWIKNYKQRDMR